MIKTARIWRYWLARVAAFLPAMGPAQVPPEGPPAQPEKYIVFIASDFKNGGAMGVYRGLGEASRKLGWRLLVEDGQGRKAMQAALLTRVIAARPHGVVFGGFDPDDFVEQAAVAQKNKIVLLGWHAAKHPGATKELIFNDSQYAVANVKTDATRKTIQACAGYHDCKVLSKRTDIHNVSAGDGSSKAMGRIYAGISQQVATVAEPLKLQGYQLADEFNRAFAGVPASGFQSHPILVTTDLLKASGNRGIEETLGFEAAYSAIWARK